MAGKRANLEIELQECASDLTLSHCSTVPSAPSSPRSTPNISDYRLPSVPSSTSTRPLLTQPRPHVDHQRSDGCDPATPPASQSGDIRSVTGSEVTVYVDARGFTVQGRRQSASSDNDNNLASDLSLVGDGSKSAEKRKLFADGCRGVCCKCAPNSVSGGACKFTHKDSFTECHCPPQKREQEMMQVQATAAGIWNWKKTVAFVIVVVGLCVWATIYVLMKYT